ALPFREGTTLRDARAGLAARVDVRDERQSGNRLAIGRVSEDHQPAAPGLPSLRDLGPGQQPYPEPHPRSRRSLLDVPRLLVNRIAVADHLRKLSVLAYAGAVDVGEQQGTPLF